MKNSQRACATLLVVPLSILGALAIARATRLGVGISPDSTAYVDCATNLLAGRGFTIQTGIDELEPLTHFPPLFPAFLALVGSLGLDPSSAARWLNLLLFAVNIVLVGLVITTHTEKPIWAPALGSYFVLTSTATLHIHSMAWTEPLFIFSSVLGLFLLGVYIETQKRLFLLISSVVAALGFMDRYIGVTLVVAGFIGITVLGKKAWGGKLVDGLIFTVSSSLPMLLWLIRNSRVAGNATNRQITFHPPTLRHARGVLSALSAWLLPDAVPDVVGWVFSPIIVFVLIALLVLLLRRQERVNLVEYVRERRETIPCLFLIFAATYLVLLLLSISFWDALTPLDTRTLAPVYVSGIILTIYLIFNLLARMDWGRTKAAYLTLAILFSSSYLFRATAWIRSAQDDGLGLTSTVWQQSETVRQLSEFPADIPIHSNAAYVIKAVDGRFAYGIPAKISSTSRMPNADYLSELEEMRERLAEGGVVVWFDAFGRHSSPSESELRDALSLVLLSRQADGAIYHVPAQESP
jgi:hypothetical protein